jgi:hydroxymethylpyrimidine pyrophosphatase-like HAD family hydrolase
VPHLDWNKRCEKDINKLFKKSRKVLKKIRREVEEHTGAQYIEMHGDPAGLISRTEEEMEWIVGHIEPIMAEVPELGWQRNSIYLRFGHRNYQKGTTLTEVARLYGLGTAQTFAAGDSHNDIEMLSVAHCAFAACPANAVGAIRDAVATRGGMVTRAAHGYGIVEALRAFCP